MRAWILVVAGALTLWGCKPHVPPQNVHPPASAARPAPEGSVYFVRRIAAATEDRLQGFSEGSEAKVVAENSEKLVVEIQGMQFEINREDATNDPAQRDRLLAPATQRETTRLIATTLRTEDRKFLDEETARRRSD